MKKKDKKEVARPQGAQMDAVRRLSSQGRGDEAQTRLDSLLRQYPGYKPLLALAWEVAKDGGDPSDVCAAAWDWASGSQQSKAAWSALAESAQAFFPALAQEAARHLRALDSQELPPEPAPQETPYGLMSFQESLRLELGNVMLSAYRFDEAEQYVQGMDFLLARNCLALVRFAKGQVGDALELLESSCQEAPHNLFALGRLVRLRLWVGGLAATEGLADALLAVQPSRAEDLEGQLQGLILLGRMAEAEAAWQRAVEQGDQSLRNFAGFFYLGAYLAWQSGNGEQARQRLAQAGDSQEVAAVSQSLLFQNITADTPDWAIGEFAAWWPLSSVEFMRTHSNDEESLVNTVNVLGAHNDYLQSMAELSGKAGRILALMVLKFRAQEGDGEAKATLCALLARPCGPDSVRMGLYEWLLDQGLLERKSAVRLWLKGGYRDVEPRNFRVEYGEMAEDCPLPEQDAVLYERVLDLYGQEELDKALERMEALFQRLPDHPKVLSNLALMRFEANYATDEFVPLAEKALALAPDYCFSRVAVAHVRLLRGDVDGAMALIMPLLERPVLHHTEWRACLGVQLEAARFRNDLGLMRDLIAELREIDRRLAE